MAILATSFLGSDARAAALTTTITFTSNAQVDTWDPIFPASADLTWDTTTCVPVPAVGIAANWVNPHKATDFGTAAHPWQPGAGFTADWINAWGNMNSQGPAGQSWTKYSSQVSGSGDFVLHLLADNCSWIYLDGGLVGFQGTTTTAGQTYPVHLNGTHNLSFLIFDGGGLAGGEYLLETNTSTVYPTTTTVTFGQGPFVFNGSAFTATATVLVGSIVQAGAVTTITYSGDCVHQGINTCTATAIYAGDATHQPSQGVATITILPPPFPTSADQCKKGGWSTYGIFRNQGDCVSFVATKGKNPPGN